jgi:rhodanese-related sulfurtransferase
MAKKRVVLLLSAAALFTVVAPRLQAQVNLSAAQLEHLLAADKSVQLVDVRTPGEIQRTGKIAGAWEMNFYAPNFKEKIARLDRKRPVALYCASGGRSASAAAQLTQMGFVKVYNYTGGMSEWLSLRKPTVPAGEKPRS